MPSVIRSNINCVCSANSPGHTGRPLVVGHAGFVVAQLAGVGDPPFDVTHRVQVLVQLLPIGATQFASAASSHLR